MATGPLALGIDLGGTKTAIGLVDSAGNLGTHQVIATRPDEGPVVWVARVAVASRAVAGPDWSLIAAAGVGSPGPLDPDTGTIIFAPNLGWQETPLRDLVARALALPAVLENDANVAALAEARFGGHGPQAKNLVYVTVSTGIGGGIVLGGRILHGAYGNAGEIGHITVEPDGPLCRCGNRGCLEALASGPAIVREARTRLSAGADSLLLTLTGGDPALVTTALVAQAAAAGDDLASQVLAKAFRYLGIGVSTLLTLFDPGVLVLGGGVTKIGEPLFSAVKTEVAARLFTAASSLLPQDRLRAATLGDHAGMVGAAALALEKVAAGTAGA